MAAPALGRVVSLHLGTGEGLPKPRVEALTLVAGHGALGDRHAGRDPDRAVLVAGLAAYQRAEGAGISIPYGALGENLLLDLDPHDLPPGARLEVGEALLELSSVCTVCASLSRFDLRLPKLLYGGRGVYARILRGGVVQVGDPVQVLVPAE
ncbi:MOSC domain-containing protein [Thermus oshimai]|uniref:MOSC domain-containing protein n=1 Tax=Thermus TaxID=270 RepID=UPI000374CDBF|nr:MOSC domain-containing protein [Thermus oshimai]